MGISCITRNAYSILPFLLLILIITPSSSSLSPTDIVTKELLNKLCSQSVFENHFCVKWLSADHRTISISVHGLMKLTVKKARAFGLKNQALMSDLARGSGKDKNLKEAYESCVNSDGVAIKELEKSQEFLRNSSFQQAFWAASKALDYAYVCKDEFEGPSNEPSLVLNHVQKFINICSVAMGFSGLFNMICSNYP